MKKTANKWLLLFASIFLMTAVACSNSAGDGDGNNDAPETPETPAETFKGIKIQIPASSIPADAMVREVYVNDEKVSSDTNNSHVRDTEWGYPFVDAGKSYQVYAKYLNSSYETILTTEAVTIQAENGLGETKCPNKTCSVTNNTLQFAHAPVVYYGDTNIASYTNLKSDTEAEYIIEVFTDSWSWLYNACLGRGANFSYTTGHNFAQHVPANFDPDAHQLRFEFYCKIEDKTYGSYRHYICKTTDRTVTLDVDDPPVFNEDNLIPNVDMTGKKIKGGNEVNSYLYYEFESASGGHLYRQRFTQSGTPMDSNEGVRTFSYDTTEGKITIEDSNQVILITKINDNFYAYDNEPLPRISGAGLDATYYLEMNNNGYTMKERAVFTNNGRANISDEICTESGSVLGSQTYEGAFTNNNGLITIAITSPETMTVYAINTGDKLYIISYPLEEYTSRPAYPPASN